MDFNDDFNDSLNKNNKSKVSIIIEDDQRTDLDDNEDSNIKFSKNINENDPINLIFNNLIKDAIMKNSSFSDNIPPIDIKVDKIDFFENSINKSENQHKKKNIHKSAKPRHVIKLR